MGVNRAKCSELKAAPEWKELEEVLKEAPARLWVTRDLDAIWTDVMANVNDRTDAVVIVEVLKVWQNFGRATGGKDEPSDLGRMQKQLELRLRTNRFGKASPTPPNEPTQQSSTSTVETPAPYPPRTWLLPTVIVGSAAALLVIALLGLARKQRVPRSG